MKEHQLANRISFIHAMLSSYYLLIFGTLHNIMSSLSLLFVVDEWCVMLCNVSHEMEHVGITIDIKPPRNRI